VVLVPEQTQKKDPVEMPKSFAGTKRWLSKLFFTELNRHVETSDGDYKTAGQVMVENIVRLATDPEQDAYVQLAAGKFILERMEGKAATAQEETHEEMPKLVICVDGSEVEKINESVKENEGASPAEDIVVEISDKDGSGSGVVIV